MAIKYNNQNVDESYANKLEANLYYGSVFVPGVTCSDEVVTGPAGGHYVHKLTTSSVEPGTPGRDFTDTTSADDLIPIHFNNNFQKSRKVYNVYSASISAPIKDENLAAAQAECREGYQSSCMACLVKEGTASADTAAPTATTCVDMVIDVRKEIVKDKGTADVVMCSPDFYAMVLKAAGKDFTPNANDRIKATGQIGNYLGMLWVEANILSAASAKYYDSTDTLQTVAFDKVDFVIYNHETLSALSNFEMARIVDSEMFSGCKAQVEQNSGFKVRNPKLARVHKHAA